MSKDSCVRQQEVVFIPGDKLTKILKELCRDVLSKEALESTNGVIAIYSGNRYIEASDKITCNFVSGFQVYFMI